MELTKLINGRTWNAGPATLNGKPATAFGVGYRNFLNSGKKWEKIDCIFNPLFLTGFEVENAPFYFKAPKRSIGYAEFISNNRFDLFRKSEITAQDFSQVIRPLGVEDVPGALFDINGNGRKDALIYPGAYAASFAGDLIYFVEQGRAPRLKKLIRFLSAPSSDVAVQFELEYGGKTELSPRNLPQGMTRVEGRDLWKTNLGKGNKLYLHSDINKNEGLYARAWDEPQKRGIGIKQPLIWDSNTGFNGPKIQKIETYLERTGMNRYLLTKIIPKSFFADAVFPVYTDTTSTFYPDPDPETNTVDGEVSRDNTDDTWSAARDTADGTGSSPSGTGMFCGSEREVSLKYNNGRVFTLFDTSSIPDGDSISSATIDLYDKNVTSGDDVIGLIQVSPASDTNLGIGDYDAMTINSPPEGATRVSSFTSNAYNTWTLNATGRGWVDKAGITKLGFRTARDIDDTAPPDTPRQYRQFSTADEAGTSQDPKLVVVHETGVSLLDFERAAFRGANRGVMRGIG